MLKCQEVMRKVSSDEFIQASWSARAGLRLHLMMCHHCRAYVRQLRALGSLARQAFRQDPPVLRRLGQRILGQFESKKPAKPVERLDQDKA